MEVFKIVNRYEYIDTNMFKLKEDIRHKVVLDKEQCRLDVRNYHRGRYMNGTNCQMILLMLVV